MHLLATDLEVKRMDASFWAAADKVIEHLRREGSGDRTIACHERSIKQLARHLDAEGAPCTRRSVSAWLEQGSGCWSSCKFKEHRTAANRLLEALETGRVSPNRHAHPGPSDYSKLSGWALGAVDRYASELRDEGLQEGTVKAARAYAAQLSDVE